MWIRSGRRVGIRQGIGKASLTRATMACFVEAREYTFSILMPLISSSIRPSSSAVLRRAASRLASRTRFFFDCDTRRLARLRTQSLCVLFQSAEGRVH